MHLGVHVSIAGRIYKSVERAEALGCKTMQIFSRNPRAWKVSPLAKSDINEFKKRRKKADISPLFIHIPYLINLASPEKELLHKSLEAYIEDIRRADSLGAEFFVTHLGSHKGKGVEFGIETFSRALNTVIAKTAPKLIILLENTSGAGNWLGGDIRHLGSIMTRIEKRSKIGVCFDTCHAYAAGYDISAKEGLNETIKELDKEIGLDRLFLIHLNDSKGKLGSHLDRHENIGKGEIGLKGFKIILNHPELKNIPLILETPKKDSKWDPTNLNVVRKIIKR